jgi:hypothetical protein
MPTTADQKVLAQIKNAVAKTAKEIATAGAMPNAVNNSNK